ncbi:SAM-dependent methyltransferase [Halobacteriales archaeon SW_7_68_16]|nr:MAG: SAM-dependent methyltransferase [Halobacteriales archaeon SW_7_68_16]
MKGQEWYQADGVAEAYEDKRFSRGGRLIDRREKRAVLDAVGAVEDTDVLEIACGTGRFSVLLADRGADVTALDISGPMLQQGREKAAAAGVDGVNFLRGDAGRLPFPDDAFDVVVAVRFFHLADTPATFMSEMRRVARETVFFDTFNRYSTRSIYNWALPMGSRLCSRAEVVDLLDHTGLELVAEDHDFLVPFGFYRQVPDGVAGAFRAAESGLARLPLVDRLASVSHWRTRVPDGPEPTPDGAETPTGATVEAPTDAEDGGIDAGGTDPAIDEDGAAADGGTHDAGD